jgi:hypothetical protein
VRESEITKKETKNIIKSINNKVNSELSSNGNNNINSSNSKLSTITSVIPEPRTHKQAKKSLHWSQWDAAMKKEMKSQDEHFTWQLVPASTLPIGKIPIDSRWVLKVKYGSSGEVLKFKARVVAKGFQQVEFEDYFDTFAPTVKMKSIKLLLALVTEQDLELKQIDYVTAFLNADMMETVYMEQPPGFVIAPSNGSTEYKDRLVCKLIKSLYGTKQAPRNWNQKLHKFLLSIGFTNLISDSCVYVKVSRTGRPIIISLYVDDKLIAYHNQDELEWQQLKSAIKHKFSIEDLGDCQWVLQMSIIRDRVNRTTSLSQYQYIKKKLLEFEPVTGKLTSTKNPCKYEHLTPTGPVDSNTGNSPMIVTPSSEHHQQYREIVGSLLYAATNTRIDIAYITNQLARYVNNPQPHHREAAIHVLRYLTGTADYALKFTSTGNTQTNTNTSVYNVVISAFSDSDWAGCPESRRSTTGYLLFVNGMLIHWCSTRQKTVATSSTEAEYMALSDTAKEIKWFNSWLTEVSILVPNKLALTPPATINVDNSAAISLTAEGAKHARTKHIDVRYHFVKEAVVAGTLVVKWIPTDQQLADLLTKRLPVVGTNCNSLQGAISKLLTRTGESTNSTAANIQTYADKFTKGKFNTA